MHDVAVVGGGPAGARAAALLARAGLSIAVIERKKSVGSPVQCAGLISPRTFELIGREFSILNRVRGADIYSPSNRTIHIEASTPRAFVVDRVGFDRELLQSAIEEGADVKLGARLSSLNRRKGRIELELQTHEGSETLHARMVIGADGPDSTVAREFGFPKPGKLLSAHGIEVGGCSIDPDSVKILMGMDVAPHFFAWVIPTGEETRIGLATDMGNAINYFPALQRRLRTLGVQAPEGGVQYVTGTIPIGPRKRTYSDNALLLGDAAGQVKATSGGGIYMGMKCAFHAAEAALKAAEAGDFSKAVLAGYQSSWEAEVGKELRSGYQLHRAFSSLSDRDMDDIFEALDKPQILEIINRVGDIDYPSKLAFSIIRKSPKLLRYVPKGILTLASRQSRRARNRTKTTPSARSCQP